MQSRGAPRSLVFSAAPSSTGRGEPWAGLPDDQNILQAARDSLEDTIPGRCAWLPQAGHALLA